MTSERLYIKTKCNICFDKLFYKNCLYCDNGLTYIEASDKALKEWFKMQTDERKQELLDMFEED